MLEFLKINNVALIKNLEIDFSKGFNVILGETGAGKSIIIDALNFVLGDKADKALIRSGEDVMKVTARFSSNNKKAKALLDEFGIECEGEVILNRTYSQSGKGDARINGEVVSVGMLKEIGNILVDAYSQNESINLLKQKNHMAILDSYKPFELQATKESIGQQLEQLNSINQEIKKLGGSEENRARQMDMLAYQIKEIEDANIQKNEDEELNKTLDKMSHAEKIIGALNISTEALEGEHSGMDLLKTALRSLTLIQGYDDSISQLAERLNGAIIEIDDIKESLFALGEEYNFDENVLEKLIQRRSLLDSMKKKYGGSLEEVFNFVDKAKEQLFALENAEEMLAEKEAQKRALIARTAIKMAELSQFRKKHAEEIEEKIIEGLAELGMPKSRFKVNFISLANSLDEIEHYSVNCLEDVEFLFSANYGEELKPLTKTISGGEMSRFMLVFKNVIAEIGGAETLIFDEIDTGISGQIANTVALKIARLSKEYQILCITHLPQVASMGDAYYFVSKGQQGDRTETQINVLAEQRIAEELAMLSYGQINDSKVAFVQEILEQNKAIKSKL